MKYNYKDGQLKSKYERKIKEINKKEEKDKSEIDDLVSSCFEEIKDIKEYKNYILNSFKKRIIILAILADLLLILGITFLILGFYKSVKDSTGVVFIIVGGALLLGAAILFGIAEYNRDKKRKFLSDIISDSELIQTKELVKEFNENNK